MDSIDIMKKSIRCLRLELPEPVMEDVEKKWSRVEFYISWLKYQINEYGSHKADCEIYQSKNECSCGYERQESDMISEQFKETEMRNGIMNRQKEALEKKDKGIERLKKLVKAAYTEGHTEGSAFYGWEDSDSYKELGEVLNG